MGQRNPIARQVVLVVEDDPLLRMMAVDLVEDAGFEAIEACDSDEAVEILQARPDVKVLFTDVEMPGKMDGVELAKWARRSTVHLGIVLTSGHYKPEVDDLPAQSIFFSKPYDFERVMNTLKLMRT